MILIPSIDLRNGRCVRLLKGNFDAETRYDLEPHELLQRYRSLGANWLHVVDLDGAKDGRLANRSVIVRPSHWLHATAASSCAFGSLPVRRRW